MRDALLDQTLEVVSCRESLEGGSLMGPRFEYRVALWCLDVVRSRRGCLQSLNSDGDAVCEDAGPLEHRTR